MAGKILYQHLGGFHEVIQVVEQGATRFMRFGPHGGWQGALNLADPERPVFAYQRAFRALVGAIEAPERFLSIGVGTGTGLKAVAKVHPACELYGVDIDETVLDVAIRFFQCPSHHRVNYWVGDGYSFLLTSNTLFDLIFVDAYLKNEIHAPMLEPRFAEILADATSLSGTVACNVIGQSPPRGKIRAFVAAAKRRFPSVYWLPVGVPFTEQNALLLLSRDADLPSRFRRMIEQAADLSWHERLFWPRRLKSL